MHAKLSRLRIFLLASVACITPACGNCATADFDIVIANGRVIDPETGLDAQRNIGVRGDSIITISGKPLSGKRIIDANGLVVAPGFIDLHSHMQTEEGYRLLALDGVTTALEMEAGVPNLEKYVAVRRGRSAIHFGATASHMAARAVAFNVPPGESVFGPGAAIAAPRSGPVTNAAASQEQLDVILGTLRTQLEAGAIGIGVGLEYTPGATRHEIIEVFHLAAAYRVPVFIHARSAGRVEPGSSVESVSEAIGAAAITGAAVHIVHLNSSCMRDSRACLSMIAGARKRGVDVTTEAYPYTAAMTFANSALFNPGWRERRGLDYGDIEIPETGARLTQRQFDELHLSEEPQLVLIHMNSEELVSAIVADSLVMIASDGLSLHPRGVGTHARVLGKYAREGKALSLSDAVRKMSLMPAQRLKGLFPDAARLGRIQPGAQADIVVFDAEAVSDRSTFRAPSEPSIGVRYLLVAGVLVVDAGIVVPGAAPGRALVRR